MQKSILPRKIYKIIINEKKINDFGHAILKIKTIKIIFLAMSCTIMNTLKYENYALVRNYYVRNYLSFFTQWVKT